MCYVRIFNSIQFNSYTYAIYVPLSRHSRGLVCPRMVHAGSAHSVELGCIQEDHAQGKRGERVRAPSTCGLTLVCVLAWSQEFHNGNWMKKQKAKLAPNLLAFTRQFNHVSQKGHLQPCPLCSAWAGLHSWWCGSSVFLHIHKDTRVHTCTHTHTHVHTRTHTYTHVHPCTHLYTHVHTYTHMYTPYERDTYLMYVCVCMY